jgi:sortase (surface protein transpeptidase)
MNNSILLNQVEKETWITDFLKEIEWNSKLNEKSKNTVLNIFIFLFKYLLTSSIIFIVLLLWANYNAYIDIAKSYLSPESMKITKDSMYTSINNTSIIKSANWDNEKSENEKKEDWLEKQISEEEKMDNVKNKTYHSMEKLVWYNKEIPINIDMMPYESRIIIPKIWKNIPLIDVEQKTVNNVKELEDVFMKELEDWVVRYPWSWKPGEVWNSFIFWHSSNFPWVPGEYNDVFALLWDLRIDDDIIVYYNQKKYIYKVIEKNVVKPWDTYVLKQMKKRKWTKEISLMTCWPVWTTLNRMIVTWQLVEEK